MLKEKIKTKDPTVGDQVIRSKDFSNVFRGFLRRKYDFGGSSFLATGKQGSGKTSFMVHYWRRVRDFSESNEKFFWRGMRKCQWPKVPEWDIDRVKLFKLNGLTLDFYEEDKKLPNDEFDITIFHNFKDLWDKAAPKNLNVVYLREPTDFMDLLTWLVDHPRKGWASLFLDEIEDVAPDMASGEMWDKVGEFSSSVKECRKSLTTLLGSTQNVSEFHWKPRRKINYFLICPGSPKISETRVWQRAIDGLEDHELQEIDTGEAWLAARNSNYDKISFPGYPTRRKMKVRIS